MKGIRRNEKGTVLLTVLCFTTMCMVIAAIALNISNRSNAQSTQNVMKSQAQITAERYLQQYLSTFPTVTGADGNPRYDYDDLKKLAQGTSEASPAKITISVMESAGSNQVNVSTDSLTNTAVYGGNCTIYVYKQGTGGVVVKAESTYDEQTGLASAYFYGETPTANLNKNAIETCGGYDVTDTACTGGDILLSNPDASVVTKFKNNNGAYHANFMTNGNLSNNPENVRFRDTLQGNAPTITSTDGYIFFTQVDIQTTVGKTDANGKHVGEGYDKDHLLNKNGYINCYKKIFLNQSANQIGNSTNPIDIYCAGAVIGLMPSTAYGPYNGTNVLKFKQDIESMFGATMANNTGDMKLYGNIYCYKNAQSGKIDDDGDFIVNTQNSLKINGDLIVDGDIWVNGQYLTVTGNVYCSGTVHGSIRATDGVTEKTVSNTLPSDARAQQPLKAYAPGLYVYGVNDTPTVYSPQNYKARNPYQMFKTENDNASTKYFRSKFQAALGVRLGDSGVAVNYTNDSALANRAVTIKKSCRLTPIQVCSNGNDGALYTVDVQDEDIWILLPAVNGSDSNGKSLVTKQNCRFRVNNPKNGHHCYFVWYRYESSMDKDDDTGVNFYTKDAGKIYGSYFYTRQTGGGNSATYVFDPNCHGEPALCTTDFADFGNQTPQNQDADTNIICLIPDDFTICLGGYGDGSSDDKGSGFYSAYHAVFYGPLAEIIPHVNTGNKIYGQVKVNWYHTDGASNKDESCRFADIENSSILHAFLTGGSADAGTLNLQYYVRHK